jgi:hypothetical protein
MTYVSPLQRKVDLYLDLVNQGVSQTQALQQVGSTLAELSASGLDLTSAADLRATIAAADLQLDNYRRQELVAERTGTPPPEPPPNFSLPSNTTVSGDQQLPLISPTPSAASVVSSPVSNVVEPSDNTRFLRPAGAAAGPVTEFSNVDLLAPGPNSVVGRAEPLPTGAGTLSQQELESGVIARTFEANANYQEVLANNNQRRQILENYALEGKTAAEAFQDPQYKELVSQAQVLSQNAQSGSTLQNTGVYENTPELQNQYPVTFESGQQSQPSAVAVDITPETPPLARPISSTSDDPGSVSEVITDIIPGEPTALELRNQLRATQISIDQDNFVSTVIKEDILDINKQLLTTSAPGERKLLEERRDALQAELIETDTRRDQFLQDRTNLQQQINQSGINVDATPVDQGVFAEDPQAEFAITGIEIPEAVTTVEAPVEFPLAKNIEPTVVATDSGGVLLDGSGNRVFVGDPPVDPAQIISQPEPLPFDPDLDTVPVAPSALSTEFNGTFSPTFDPDSDSWGVWDNQQGRFVVTGLSQQQANIDAQEFADEGFTLAPSLAPGQDNTTFNGSFSASFDPETQTWGVWDDLNGTFVRTGLTEGQANNLAIEFVNDGEVPPPPAVNTTQAQAAGIQAVGEQQNATLALARQQQSIREQRGQQNQGDWRVKLRLAPGANYLYKSNDPGILWPLLETDGVVFPYTPRIDTSYRAIYDAVDLTHSNYRGYFYRSSYADFVQVSTSFTAQDTFEAEYLLAVITFFKSLTKMFYGQDAQRGSPPPLVYLTGLGEYQFSEHPCVVTQFNYNLPDNVDYIRARIANVNATNLLVRRNPKNAPSNPISSALQRLASLGQGIKPGALNSPPPPPTLGIDNPTYVPTKLDVSLQLLPMQSRRQVSQQFSLKNFANGNLIKGGFW